MGLTFHEITDVNDDLLLHWLDLYEVSFPPEEKLLVSRFLWLLKPDIPEKPDCHLLAVLDQGGEFVGLMCYDIAHSINAYSLWYFATVPQRRGSGLGAACYAEVIRRASEAGAGLLVFEVEVPEDSADADISRRRIEFYRRQGAKLVRGIHFTQKIGDHTRRIQMNLMAHPLRPIPPADVLEVLKNYYGDDLRQVGEVSLE